MPERNLARYNRYRKHFLLCAEPSQQTSSRGSSLVACWRLSRSTSSLHTYVTKVNGWTTMYRCGEPGNGMLLRATCADEFPGQSTYRKRRCIGGRGKMARAADSTVSTTTSCTFPQDNSRRTMRFGPSRRAVHEISLWRIRSTGTASATAPASLRTRMARSTSTSRTPLQ